MDDKRALRRRLRDARAQRSATELARAGADLARHANDVVGQARTVAAYASIGDEPPTRLLLDELLRLGIRPFLPRVVGDDLAWVPYESWTDLATAGHGLLEPTAAALPQLLTDLADVVLVPALAVDRRGSRLGRGAGYFDRALHSVDRRRLIAVVFDDEVLDELPTEPHDVPVGGALTPSGVVRLAGQ